MTYRSPRFWSHDPPQLGPLLRDRMSWVHSGLDVNSAGELFAFHGGYLYAARLEQGTARQMDVGAVEGHGITLTTDGSGFESVWIADPGRASRASADPGVEDGIEVRRGRPQVIRVATSGEFITALPEPAIGAEAYSPTSVAVSDPARGGDGCVWVADGYGSSLIHRFDETGVYMATFSGEESAGRFSTPHALLMDYSGDSPELFIADRGNRRLVVLDAASGRYLREAGRSFLTSPSDMTVWQEEYLVIAELRARLTVVDRQFRLVEHLGSNPDALKTEGWPNGVSNGRKVRATQLREGRFNSPHAVVARGDDLIVTEWLIGGRYTVLRP